MKYTCLILPNSHGLMFETTYIMSTLPLAFHGHDFVEPLGSHELSLKSTVLASFQAAHKTLHMPIQDVSSKQHRHWST
jgi:hypothetical protein